jgi:hypothetical protein
MDQDSMAELRERFGLTEKEVASLCEKAARHGMSRNHIENAAAVCRGS